MGGPSTVLLLFDIDGTLLHSGRAATRAIEAVFRRRYAVENAMDGVAAAGRTDPAILREMFLRNLGREYTPAEAASVFRDYVAELERELARERSLRVLPGVERLLQGLATTPGVVLGLATGNVEPGAWVKLRAAGLEGYFRFGGFGSDCPLRSGLVRTAIRRAADRLAGSGRAITRVVVVGDTTHDILHGRAAGAEVAAVATGVHGAEELARLGPDHLFHDLSDTEAVVKALRIPYSGATAASYTTRRRTETSRS